MKTILVITIGLLLLQSKNSLVNSVWAHKITGHAIKTLTFKLNGVVLEYDSELNYTFHSAYKLIKDTIIINGKDNSHSEDGGKIDSYWVTKCLIKRNALIVVTSKKLVRGKWSDQKIQPHDTPDYVKIK